MTIASAHRTVNRNGRRVRRCLRDLVILLSVEGLPLRIILAVMLLINSHRALLYGVGWFLTHCEVSSKEACRRWILIYDGRVRALRCGAQRERFDERMCMITRDTDCARSQALRLRRAFVCLRVLSLRMSRRQIHSANEEETYRPAEITDEEVADVLSAFYDPTTLLFSEESTASSSVASGTVELAGETQYDTAAAEALCSIRPSTLLWPAAQARLTLCLRPALRAC